MRSVGSQPSTCLGKRGEVADLGDARRRDVSSRQAGQEPLMVGGDVAVDVGLGRQQGRDRDDEAHRLHVAEPFEMRQVFRVLRHGVILSPARDRPVRPARCAVAFTSYTARMRSGSVLQLLVEHRQSPVPVALVGFELPAFVLIVAKVERKL